MQLSIEIHRVYRVDFISIPFAQISSIWFQSFVFKDDDDGLEFYDFQPPIKKTAVNWLTDPISTDRTRWIPPNRKDLQYALGYSFTLLDYVQTSRLMIHL
jgi:hypothetical protein